MTAFFIDGADESEPGGTADAGRAGGVLKF
jgi:hypothetical protein